MSLDNSKTEVIKHDIKTVKPEEKNKTDKKEEMKHDILTEEYLWDMRCWDKYKDRAEVEKWIENGYVPNNCSHIVGCIEKLLSNGVGKEEIIKLIMKNPHIQYKNRLAKCFENPNLCPIYKEKQNYSDCKCERCE